MRRRAKNAQAVETRPVQPTPAEAYAAKFGKPPHHRMKPETILERLSDDISDSGAKLRKATGPSE